MEGRHLVTTVHVHQDDGTVVVYGPGDSVPDVDAVRITNPDVWAEGEGPAEPPSDSPQIPSGPVTDLPGLGVPDVADPEGVPVGTADEILAWVGIDPGRASLAREAEESRGKPRSGLLDRLDRVLAAGE
jgi:hypothetical protein